MAKPAHAELLVTLGIASYFHDTPKEFRLYLGRLKALYEKRKSKPQLLSLKSFMMAPNPFEFVRKNSALIFFQSYKVATVVRGLVEYEMTIEAEAGEWFNELELKESTLLNIAEYHFRSTLGFVEGCIIITGNPDIGFTGNRYVRWLDGWRSPIRDRAFTVGEPDITEFHQQQAA